MLYTQSDKYLKFIKPVESGYDQEPDVQIKLLAYVLQNSKKEDCLSVIQTIDRFCWNSWMMNLGDVKSHIIIDAINQKKPKKIVQIGGYCGYSALVLAHHSSGQVHTVQISAQYAKIAREIHKHAGVDSQVTIHVGRVAQLQEELKALGNIDMVFIDHDKKQYLSDLNLLQSFGLIKGGCLVIGDNIIYPGSPDYLQYFKSSKQYRSVLYHTQLQYCGLKDAVLVSEKI